MDYESFSSLKWSISILFIISIFFKQNFLFTKAIYNVIVCLHKKFKKFTAKIFLLVSQFAVANSINQLMHSFQHSFNSRLFFIITSSLVFCENTHFSKLARNELVIVIQR